MGSGRAPQKLMLMVSEHTALMQPVHPFHPVRGAHRPKPGPLAKSSQPSPPSPPTSKSVLVVVTFAAMKHHGQKQPKEERVHLHCASTALCITKGSQGRNSAEFPSSKATLPVLSRHRTNQDKPPPQQSKNQAATSPGVVRQSTKSLCT